jgi:hypothetical protein
VNVNNIIKGTRNDDNDSTRNSSSIEHLDMLASMNNLALTYSDQGKTADAAAFEDEAPAADPRSGASPTRWHR